MVKGVRPLAAIPINDIIFGGLALGHLGAAQFAGIFAGLASAPKSFGPPAMMNWTRVGEVAKVGGISEASSAPMRPLVPVPT